MRLVDTHCHFDDREFDRDRDAALARAHDAGVTRIVVPAIGFANWDAVRAVCGSHAGLVPAYGLHPLCLRAHRPAHLDALREWIAREWK